MNYLENFKTFLDWIKESIDEIRNYILPTAYPLYILFYIDMIRVKEHKLAYAFLRTFSSKFEIYSKEIEELSLFKEYISKELLPEVVKKFEKNKIHLYIPKIVYSIFINFLQTNELIIILKIFNARFEISHILSETYGNKNILIDLTSKDVENINCYSEVYTNIVKSEYDLSQKLSKKDKEDGGLFEKAYLPIPLQYYNHLPIDITLNIDEKNPPTVGCFTILNSHNKVYSSDFVDDLSMLAIGFKSGLIHLWYLDPKRREYNENLIKHLEDYKKNYYDKMMNEEEVVIENTFDHSDLYDKQAYENVIKKRKLQILNGHSNAVFSLSFCNSKKYLLSGSFDETIRLWSTLLKETIMVCKGHFSPVFSVKFSPLTYYFASGGGDKTAKIWTLNSNYPMRQFVGHLSDVEIVTFHPNGFYLITSSNDKTIRMWCIESGECVRIFVNKSEFGYVNTINFTSNGKLLLASSESTLMIYDIVRLGDCIKIINNICYGTINTICIDSDDNMISIANNNNEIMLLKFNELINDLEKQVIDFKSQNKIAYKYKYHTKKSPVMLMKFNQNNLLFCLSRFEDVNTKIFI